MIFAPAYYVLVGLGVSSFRPPKFKPVIIAIIGIALLGGTLQYHHYSRKAAWREVAKMMEFNLQKDDLVVFHPGLVGLAFDYYYQKPYAKAGFPASTFDQSGDYLGNFVLKAAQEVETFYERERAKFEGDRRVWLINAAFVPGQNRLKTGVLLQAYLDKHLLFKSSRTFHAIEVRLYENDSDRQ